MEETQGMMETQEALIKLDETVKVFASLIHAVYPDGREKSLALTKLDECVMWLNASLSTINQVGESNGNE